MKHWNQTTWIGSLFLLLALAAVATAAVPDKMHYQGKLLDADGIAADDGTYNMVFRLLNDSGAEVWNSGQMSVEVTDGVFNVLLGPIDPDKLVFNQQFDLEVQVDGDTLEAHRLATDPYAFYAHQAHTVDHGAISSAKIANGSIEGRDIKDQTISTTQIKDGTITGADIADHTVTYDKLKNFDGNGSCDCPGRNDLSTAQVAICTCTVSVSRNACLDIDMSGWVFYKCGGGTGTAPASIGSRVFLQVDSSVLTIQRDSAGAPGPVLYQSGVNSTYSASAKHCVGPGTHDIDIVAYHLDPINCPTPTVTFFDAELYWSVYGSN